MLAALNPTLPAVQGHSLYCAQPSRCQVSPRYTCRTGKAQIHSVSHAIISTSSLFGQPALLYTIYGLYMGNVYSL